MAPSAEAAVGGQQKHTVNTQAKPCALIYDDGGDVRLIGGQKLGYSEAPLLELGFAGSRVRPPRVLIHLSMPRKDLKGAAHYYSASGQPNDNN